MREKTSSSILGNLILRIGNDTGGYSKLITAAIKQFFGVGKDNSDKKIVTKSSLDVSTPKEDPQNDKTPYRIGRAFFCFGTKP